MVRERRLRKEKVVEDSSTRDTFKKRKTAGIEIQDSEMEAARKQRHHEMLDAMVDTLRKAVWEKGALSKMPAEFLPKLFYEKMRDEHSIKENMCFEKAVLSSDFKALGFFEKFTALGWEVVVSFKGNAGGKVYVKSVMEWMSTLKKG
ncbi:hypothetical protein HanXRQr2_Chr16g0746801 [Helianthus annuus]|uniref:Uncharacterized protein n=1 Tax=Helianthus annuus TaxID=4232 RepID=A0A9K3DQS2_HELAN|nr:hypothetical protein HanXRQr2_Chr16g0746801 [Helianthus annuus]KAJ0438006.1 hypothetical protein HanHA300_Chr16g0608971 [Helianthus annuus]KAJ0442615.1 hypothetical protein HanIR_Chr16g0811421 [Helianthus annuus]